MIEDYIINHLRLLLKMAKEDLEEYKRLGASSLVNYQKGVIDGYEVAIEWLEDNKN